MNIKIDYLERHDDSRGLLVEVLKQSQINESIRHIYFSSSIPGAVRGNHYHKRKIEWFCVVKGKGNLILADNNTGDRKEMIQSGDQPSIVKIMPHVSHAIQNIGDSEMLLIAIANEVFNPEDPDTYPASLVVV